MKLLGIQLQQAGIEFISAKAVHNRDMRIDEIVCATQEDVDKANAWATEHSGQSLKARLATHEELEEHEWMEKNL